MPQDDSLLTAVESWYEREQSVLASKGVKATLRGKSTGRSKNCIVIELEAGTQVLQASVWDSGEAEFLRTNLSSSNDPHADVRKVDSSAAVDDLLDIAVRLLVGE